jgi:twitching motility protein PilT
MSTRTELLLKKIISQMISQNVQGLHLSAGQAPVARQDGKLQNLVDVEVVSEDFILDLTKTMLTAKEQQTLEQHKELITIKELGSLGRFKLNFYYQKGSIALTMKLIPTQVPKLSELNLPDKMIQLINLPKGLVLISGPFDSGRSTLSAAMLQSILNAKSVRLMTLEDPLEYLLKNNRGKVEQRQVGRDVESFESGLELLLQEDVEVVFVSNISGSEAAQNLVNLALANRLVIALIASDSAIRALETFIALAQGDKDELFETNLADALAAVVNLRLLPRQGMPGRIYAAEVLLNTAPLKLALKEKDFNRMQNILQTSRQDGMVTLDQSLLDLAVSGQVSKEIAFEVAHEPTRLKGLLK